MAILELTQKNFDEILDEHHLVVIDFWAQWCEPCRAFKKVIETVDKKYPAVIFAHVNIDKEKELAQDFNIMSVPAVMILRDRVVVFAQTGVLTIGAMVELLDQAKNLAESQLRRVQEGDIA